jgi:hypothetical protein
MPPGSGPQRWPNVLLNRLAQCARHHSLTRRDRSLALIVVDIPRFRMPCTIGNAPDGYMKRVTSGENNAASVRLLNVFQETGGKARGTALCRSVELYAFG